MDYIDKANRIITSLFTGYICNGSYPINDAKNYLAQLFAIDNDSFEKIINRTESNDCTLANIIVRCVLLLKELQEITACENDDQLTNAYNTFLTMAGELEYINASIGCYEDLNSDSNCFNHTLFKESISLVQLAQHLHPAYKEVFKFSFESINILIYLLSYELYTKINNCLFITILMAIKHSPIIDGEIKTVAEEIYSFFFTVLREAHIVNIEINALFQDSKMLIKKRNKNNSNTTRFHAVYSYDNYDCYSIRFDLAHEGVLESHFNIISPGKIKYGFLYKDEYESFVGNHPNYHNCFIEESGKYYVKERNNVVLDEEFESLMEHRIHRFSFSKGVEESVQLEYFNILGVMLSKYVCPIEKTDVFNSNSFHLDRLIGCLGWILLNDIHGDDKGKVLARQSFVERCERYGFDTNKDILAIVNDVMILSIGEKEFIH